MNSSHDKFYVVPPEMHDGLVRTLFARRGYDEDESRAMAQLCHEAARHGIRTHNAIKALHLDDLFGSKVGGCRPCATVVQRPCRFAAARIWDANRKLGPSVAYKAMDTAMLLADEFGIGMVSVDNAWHYLWGGAYVLEAARRGYVAYTQCTAMLAEVVPFGGRAPTLGTNPHSWAFPTIDAVGFPILVDWATSVMAMGRVQQFKREGKSLPPNVALDSAGAMTTDPARADRLLPFGEHKGYGLALVDELMAALIGGSLPTIRGRFEQNREKKNPCFFFQVIHPQALDAGAFAQGRSQGQNVKEVLTDILGHGNEKALLPGQIEAEFAAHSQKHGGLLFTAAEIEALNEHAAECGAVPLDLSTFPRVEL